MDADGSLSSKQASPEFAVEGPISARRPRFASLLIPTLIAGTIYALLTIGLVRRSRIAYVIAFLVAAAPAGSWVYLAVTGDPLTFQPIPLILGTPPLLVVVGLAASWRTVWERAPSPSTP